MDIRTQKEFIAKEWQRLADFYGVSVEELQSPEFDKKMQAGEQREIQSVEQERKKCDAKVLRIGIVVFVVVGFLFFPFSGWYVIFASAVATYNYCAVEDEIVDEKTSRSTLAWSAAIRALIVVATIAVCIALHFNKGN